MNRSEIRWRTFQAPDKRPPVLLLTRDEAINALNEIIVAPVTRTVRGIASDVRLTVDDGMQTVCAAKLDHIGLVYRSQLGTTIATLRSERWLEVRAALLVACAFSREGG